MIFLEHPTAGLCPSSCFNLASNSTNWQDLGSFSSLGLSGVKVLSNFLVVDTVPAGTLPWELHCHLGLMKGPFQLAHLLYLIVHIPFIDILQDNSSSLLPQAGRHVHMCSDPWSH